MISFQNLFFRVVFVFFAVDEKADIPQSLMAIWYQPGGSPPGCGTDVLSSEIRTSEKTFQRIFLTFCPRFWYNEKWIFGKSLFMLKKKHLCMRGHRHDFYRTFLSSDKVLLIPIPAGLPSGPHSYLSERVCLPNYIQDSGDSVHCQDAKTVNTNIGNLTIQHGDEYEKNAYMFYCGAQFRFSETGEGKTAAPGRTSFCGKTGNHHEGI